MVWDLKDVKRFLYVVLKVYDIIRIDLIIILDSSVGRAHGC